MTSSSAAERVVDGSGSPSRTADIAVQDGLIAEVGRIDGTARRTIDADGLTVTPGFVDVHTHFDGQATWDPHLTPSCWHGVTTAILGNCGIGFAPVHADRHDWLIELMEGVEDIPGSALSEGITWEWETFGEYLDALERMPRAVDVGTQIPQAALRAYVMGDRAMDAPTADDLSIDVPCRHRRLGGRGAGHVVRPYRRAPQCIGRTRSGHVLGRRRTRGVDGRNGRVRWRCPASGSGRRRRRDGW